MATIPDPVIRAFTREEFYELVWSRPVSTAAAEFGKSGVALYKMCRRHGIPTPPQGWWTRQMHGKAQVRTPLPPREDAPLIIMHLGAGPASSETRAAIKLVRNPARLEPYPGFPHPFVSELMARLRQARRGRHGLVRRRAKRGYAVQVTKSSLDRVEYILGCLTALIERQGAVVCKPDEGIVIRVGRQRVSVQFTEIAVPDSNEFTVADDRVFRNWRRKRGYSCGAAAVWPDADLVAPSFTGRLTVELAPVTFRGFRLNVESDAARIFTDGEELKLENRLDDIVAAIMSLVLARRDPWPNSLFQQKTAASDLLG